MITKSFVTDISDSQVADTYGSTNYCSWQRLKPYLEQACHIDKGEEVYGIRIDNNGIQIQIRFKEV